MHGLLPIMENSSGLAQGGSHMKRLTYKRGTDDIPTIGQAKDVACLALIAIGGIVYFVVTVVVLHFLRPEYNPINHAVSNYAVGPYGYLMTSAFYALALSVLALALGLFRCLVLTDLSRVAILLLCLASSGMIVMGIFPGDVHALHPPATITGVVHWIAAGISFLSIMIAAFLLSSFFKMDERLQVFPTSLLDSSTGYGWSVIVVWDTGDCWLDRYWATYLSCCVFAVVAGFGGVDVVY
jgi:uncharacterized protein DUF998